MSQNQAVTFYFAHLHQCFAVLYRKMQRHTLQIQGRAAVQGPGCFNVFHWCSEYVQHKTVSKPQTTAIN